MKEIKNSRKGFTLLELLVVVVIIGILAAIALPQYQMAVGKARFSELKTVTQSVQQAAQRYYLVNNTYVSAKNNLDIEIPNGIVCSIWNETQQAKIACHKSIFKKEMWFYVHRESGLPSACVVYSLDKTDKANRLCQKETNKTANQAKLCENTICYYYSY